MDNSSQDIVRLKQDLADALLVRLASQPQIKAITMQELASDTESELDNAYSVFSAPTDVFLWWFENQVTSILIELSAEFKDAPDATIHEKILEALMHMLEVFSSQRDGLRALHQWAYRNPAFGIALGQFALQASDRLLAICGDTPTFRPVQAFRRSLRVKGLMGVLIRIRPLWLNDDTPGLSKTFNQLDKQLEQARELAISLRLFDDEITDNEDVAATSQNTPV